MMKRYRGTVRPKRRYIVQSKERLRREWEPRVPIMTREEFEAAGWTIRPSLCVSYGDGR